MRNCLNEAKLKLFEEYLKNHNKDISFRKAMLERKKVWLFLLMPIVFSMIIPAYSVDAQTSLQPKMDLDAAGFICDPGVYIEINGDRTIKIEGYTKEKTKDGTTIVITKKIDENSPIIEELLDNGKVISIKIIVCSIVYGDDGEQKTTKYTIIMDGATIEKITQEVNDDGTPAKESITIKGKKSKSTFEK